MDSHYSLALQSCNNEIALSLLTVKSILKKKESNISYFYT